MERMMSVEDKIKRAEEIYYKRKERDIPVRETIKKSTNEKKNIKLFKKMIKQIIICLMIYAVFYLVINNNYIFSEDFTNKAKEILSQDIDFKLIYSYVSEKIKNMNVKPEIDNTEKTEIQENQVDIQNNNENIGGAEEILTGEIENVENTAETNETGTEGDTSEQQQDQPEVVLSQAEQDANYLKNKINFIKPVEGKICSMFGPRNPTTPTVPKNHTGTDIAAETGTKIVSATDGTVIVAENRGDYGKHIKIQIEDVILVYAHCNKLYVKEGDTISQGQEIAEVGATGNVTGPHLHFEVRYQDRYVDPQLILGL